MRKSNVSGEVAAIKGYEFQYSIFASEIYSALLNNDNQIEWIEFASNNTGKIDDVLIGLSDRILAFQIKNISSSNFTYASLTEADTQSILEGMFVGWKKLKVSNVEKRLDVRFITTQSSSDSDRITDFLGSNKPSFQYFLNNFWIPLSVGRYDGNSLPKVWGEVFEGLLKTAKASSREEMIAFIKETKFVFDYSIPNYLDSYVERQRGIDIENIAKHIFKTVSRRGNIRYTKKEFLEEFGLTRRYASYYTHSFFVDEDHYQSINETWNEIDSLIKHHSNGYIALIGNAGSGKSTLLTKWLQQSNYKILRYYAYVNVDMNYDFGFRGEAESFLHDLLVQIRQSSASLQDRLPTADLIDLQRHLNDELNKLSREEEKVIIIVDGLDHIEREQDVTRSLMSVLPLPANIPDKIYFVLGSRRIENLEKLSPRITNSIITENRIIKIKPLSKEKSQKLLSSYQITLPEELLDQLYINTKGHPLFLRYTIEAIRNRRAEELNDIISQKIFSGDIDSEYKVFWEENKDQDDFVEVLGVMARFRHSYFDVQLLNAFEKISRANKIKVNRLSEDYFYKTGSIWQFFHSSFKEFLLKETAKDLFTNEFDKDLDRQYHLRIHEATKDITTAYKWNEIYHLHKAEQFVAITNLVSQNYFRAQWFEYRNYKLIKEDIQLAIDACNRQKDIYCLFRCFLCLFELKQRYANFDPSDYFSTFHKLGKIALANSFVYDNVELLVSPAYALNYSIELYKQDYKQVAFDIFSRATPIFILDQTKRVNPRRFSRHNYQETDEVKLISTWAKAASLFISVDEVFQRIDGLTVEEPNSHEEVPDLFAEVFSEVSDISIELENWDNLKALEKVLLRGEGSYERFYFYYDIVKRLTNENEFYDHCLRRVLDWEITDNNPINRRVLEAYLFYRKDLEKAKEIFEKVLAPHEVDRPDYSLDDTTYVHYIFDYSSYLYIVTKDFSIPTITFLPQENKHTKKAFFNAFAELGKSVAYIYHDQKDAAIDYYFKFNLILQLFHYNHSDYGYEYSISNNKSVLINLVLKISSKLSIKIFDWILQKLGNEWENYKRFWNLGDKQKIIEAVIDLKGDNEWVTKELEKIDNDVFERGYLSERVEEGITQIGLWSKAGNRDKGESILNHVMVISFDVRGEKDSQLDYIVQWLDIIKNDTSDEIEFYLQRVNSLNDKVNSRTHTPALELLRLALRFGNGFEVFRYLLFEGLITLTDGLEILLSYLLSSNPQNRSLLVKVFARVLMAYDNQHHERNYYLGELFKLSPKLSENELKNFAEEIRIYSISEYRNDYLYQVQEYALNNNVDLAMIGIASPIQKTERYSNTDTSEITLKDGRKMSSSDLFQNIHTVGELQDIQSQSEYYGSFNWSNIYEKVFSNASDGEIFEYVQQRGLKSLELAKVAKTLIKHNRYFIAKELLHSAISKGEKYGWVHFMDGGSKIVPFELLYEIEDKNIFNKIAFKDFSESVTSFDIQSYEILLKDALQIWKFFSNDINLGILYSEVKEFRSELLKTHKIDTSSPSVKGNLDTEELLLELMHFLITFPSDFGYALNSILVEELVTCKNVVRRVLKRLFDEEFFAKYIKLVAIISTRDKSIAIENQENVIYLLNNSRYDITTIAYRILKGIDIDPDAILTKKLRELPFMYSMEFKYTPSFLSSQKNELEHINKNGFLKETEDPLLYINLYRTEVEHLSEETGIAAINIAYRIMALGTHLEFPYWCNSISEEEIRKIYSGRFDLKISYKRPRYQLVWDGLMKVIKELWELEIIDTALADELSNEFDPRSYLIKTTPQPPFVISILKENSGRAPSADKGWAGEMTDDYLSKALSFKTAEDSVILAEHSILHGMGWGQTEEVRQSFIGLNSKVNWGKHWKLIFNPTSENRIQDYEQLKDSGIILYNYVRAINKKRNWLAINPLVCKDLKLVFNPDEGNFRWDDGHGNKIVESIYWQIHSTDNRDQHHDSEAGYGWYVILYEKGYEIFKRLIMESTGADTVYQHRKISRHLEYSQEKYQTDLKEDFSKTRSNILKL
jgi:hypothetical protein